MKSLKPNAAIEALAKTYKYKQFQWIFPYKSKRILPRIAHQKTTLLKQNFKSSAEWKGRFYEFYDW